MPVRPPKAESARGNKDGHPEPNINSNSPGWLSSHEHAGHQHSIGYRNKGRERDLFEGSAYSFDADFSFVGSLVGCLVHWGLPSSGTVTYYPLTSRSHHKIVAAGLRSVSLARVHSIER